MLNGHLITKFEKIEGNKFSDLIIFYFILLNRKHVFWVE